ncbi:hypothetical protein [Candidatus Leptofilum sp.]|uniref:hypothetical protein n=1 Tax=Candidatus Leptofilum sp. TaxID=3241576 RepID=UPI003B5BB384
MTKPQTQTLFLLSFTTILVGYFMVWLPGPSAGLQLLGFEMGEWTKFFGLGVKRNWFYLPPITLALCLLFFTVEWENGRYQTWLFRGAAVVVSLLAFPALEDITDPTNWREYVSRMVAIGLVVTVAGLLTFMQKRPWRFPVSRILMVVAGLVGLILPTLIYLEVRPFASDLMRLALGYGPGFWLNIVGHTAVILLAGLQLAKKIAPPTCSG